MGNSVFQNIPTHFTDVDYGFHQSTISISLRLSRSLEFGCNLKGWNWWNDGKGACGDGQIVYESVL